MFNRVNCPDLGQQKAGEKNLLRQQKHEAEIESLSETTRELLHLCHETDWHPWERSEFDVLDKLPFFNFFEGGEKRAAWMVDVQVEDRRHRKNAFIFILEEWEQLLRGGELPLAQFRESDNEWMFPVEYIEMKTVSQLEQVEK